MRKLFVILLASLLLVPCALAQEPKPEQVPPAEPAAPAAEPKADTQVTVYFYRYKQFVGSGLEPSVFCDEVQLARMDNGRYFIIKLDPGKHSFRSNDKQSGVELELKPGQSYYMRVEIATGFWKGHGRIVAALPEQGAFEVKKLQYISADKVKSERVLKQDPAATAAPK